MQLEGSGIDAALVFATGRVLGRIQGSSGAVDIPGVMLGRGRVTLYAAGRGGPSPAESVNAVPVIIEVGD